MKYRKNHLEAMEQALTVLEEIDAEFGKQFGRSYGGGIEKYRLDDADVVLVTIAGMSGTAKDAVDCQRPRNQSRSHPYPLYTPLPGCKDSRCPGR